MPRKKNSKNKERSKIEDGLKSFELDDIDKICREIETDEERRQRRKRSHQDSLPTEAQTREARENRKESVKLEMKRPGNRDWVLKTVDIVIEHLNKFGACIIDDFLGPDRGHDILEEVESLQAAQMFRGGQLVTASATADRFRTDQITWTDGISPPSPSIRHLISTLDSIVTAANVRPDRGGLAEYDISGRTNAMVACYPGQGAHYVRHVDNPNGDGRCITAIYYLNKDWNPERDGGALKIYSTYLPGVVATIDPMFDRVIFFWSDRRNPHEVMPAFRERYAITVWYLDGKEKEQETSKGRLKN